MGLDLKLLPFYSNRAGGMEFSHAVLTCGRDYDLFNAMRARAAQARGGEKSDV